LERRDTPNEEIRPHRDTARIIVIYLVMGMLWILFSDRALSLFARDLETFQRLQLYKGWAYIFVSGAVFYLILLRQFSSIRTATDKINEDNKRLNEAVANLEAARAKLEKQGKEQSALLESLRQGRELLDNIILNAPAFLMMVDKDGAITQMGPYVEPLLEYRRDELMGRIARHVLVSPDYRQYAEEIFSRIMAGVQKNSFEMAMMTRGGSEITLLLNASLLHSNQGEVLGILLIGMDISEKHRMEARLKRLAYQDQLTKLPNLAWLHEEGQIALRNAAAVHRKAALCYMDIDDFKHVNETMGHDAGDTLLTQVAERFSATLRQRQTVYRLGGDEFVLLLADVRDRDDLSYQISMFLDALEKTWVYRGEQYRLSVSAGTAVYPDDGIDIGQLLQNSDAALSQAKICGKNRVVSYDDSMRESAWSNLRRHNAQP